ncbi:MAG TPA: hypothetical protein VGV38_05230 [Pyrinomonadaceae bacterium]|nr:hypothetical protein [Pyrinomonadaceae bacterium]
MRQPTFFDKDTRGPDADADQIVLYALGDFQARGLALVERDLPLDRLRGALRRAAEKFGAEELSDESAAAAFERLGARVRRVPAFFAKHPFRVVVPEPLASRAQDFYRQQTAQE